MTLTVVRSSLYGPNRGHYGPSETNWGDSMTVRATKTGTTITIRRRDTNTGQWHTFKLPAGEAQDLATAITEAFNDQPAVAVSPTKARFKSVPHRVHGKR